MKTLSAHYSFTIKLRQMKFIKVVLGLRDGCLESNCVLKTVQMVQIVLYSVSRASACKNNSKEITERNKNGIFIYLVSQYSFKKNNIRKTRARFFEKNFYKDKCSSRTI